MLCGVQNKGTYGQEEMQRWAAFASRQSAQGRVTYLSLNNTASFCSTTGQPSAIADARLFAAELRRAGGPWCPSSFDLT